MKLFGGFRKTQIFSRCQESLYFLNVDHMGFRFLVDFRSP
jgi:hypothetical protein